MNTTSSSIIYYLKYSTSAFILLALSYNNLAFACPNSISPLSIIQHNKAVKINHGLLVETTADGEDIVEAANGSIIN